MMEKKGKGVLHWYKRSAVEKRPQGSKTPKDFVVTKYYCLLLFILKWIDLFFHGNRLHTNPHKSFSSSLLISLWKFSPPANQIQGKTLQHSRSGWTGLWATWSSWRWPCLLQGEWTTWPLKVPSNPKHSMVLWFYDSYFGQLYFYCGWSISYFFSPQGGTIYIIFFNNVFYWPK